MVSVMQTEWAVAIPCVVQASDGVRATSANLRGMLYSPMRLALHFSCFTLRNKTQVYGLVSSKAMFSERKSNIFPETGFNSFGVHFLPFIGRCHTLNSGLFGIVIPAMCSHELMVSRTHEVSFRPLSPGRLLKSVLFSVMCTVPW